MRLPLSQYKDWIALVGVLVLGMGLGVLALAYVLAGELYEYQDTVDGAKLPPADAIVVLAGGRGRIATAGDLWYRYWEQSHRPQANKTIVVDSASNLPTLYLSGMGQKFHWQTLERHVRPGVYKVLSPQNVVIETESFNTETNALWLSRYAQQHGWRRIIVMTSSYHMKRARMVFERALGQSSPPIAVETLSIYQEPFEPGDWRGSLNGIYVTLVEYLKLLFYRYHWKH